jgi:cytochrome b561
MRQWQSYAELQYAMLDTAVNMKTINTRKIKMNSVSPKYYSRLQIALHWLVLVIVLGLYCSMEFRGVFERGSDARALMKLAHFTLGMALLWFTVGRLALRLFNLTPAVIPPLAPWQARLSLLMQVALYGLCIAMPLLGWMLINAEGHVLSVLGVDWPSWVAKDHALAERLEDLHKTGASAGYLLIGAHAVAGLYHHYVRRDNVLQRMLGRDLH